MAAVLVEGSVSEIWEAKWCFIMIICTLLMSFSPFSLLTVFYCFILGFHDEDTRNKHDIYCFLIYKSGIHWHEKYHIWQMLINVVLILHHIFSCKCYLISLLIYCFIIHGPGIDSLSVGVMGQQAWKSGNHWQKVATVTAVGNGTVAAPFVFCGPFHNWFMSF